MNFGIMSRLSIRNSNIIARNQTTIHKRTFTPQMKLHKEQINNEKADTKTLINKNNQLFEGQTGGQIVADMLLQHNCKDVFMYSGGAIMPVIDAFHEHEEFNYYITAHEQSLGHAATGYAKASGKIGVAIVTSGPGLTNMVTPILDANNDSTPLIVFSGQVPLAAMGTCAFQECPATSITESVTKFNYCLQSTEEIPFVIDYAMHVAQHGKKGAVHVDIPKCVSASKYCSQKASNLCQEMINKFEIPQNEKEEPITKSNENDEMARFKRINKRAHSCSDKITNLRYPVDDVVFAEMADLINKAHRPIFYIGQGCENACDLLANAVNTTQIPVTSTLHAMGIFDETNNLSLQMCGMHGSYAANHALQNADLIIAIGSRFDDRTTGVISKYAPKAQEAGRNGKGGIIHVNIQSDQINKVLESDHNFIMDSRDFLDGLVPFLSEATHTEERKQWLGVIDEWKNQYPFQFVNCEKDKLKTQTVIKEINDFIINHIRPQKNPKNVIITTGVGNHQMYSAQFFDWYRPNKIISSGSLGVMGSSNGYAIGAQIADIENNMVISVDGDGSFNMTTSELMTMVKYKLPIKIALMNDSNLTMVKVWEKLFYNERYVATQNPCNPDYVALAESYGIKALKCDNINKLPQTVKEFMEYNDGPILCEFQTLSEECYPLVAPGKGLDEMILWDTTNQEKLKKMEGQMAPN